MASLSPDLRRDLEKAVVAARAVAASGARSALQRLGVAVEPSPRGLRDDDRRLRVQLRAKMRADGKERLVEEIAYEQWHRMLFARFLAESGLLFHPGGAPVSLADVKDLAAEEGERDPWVLGARYAAAMLPGIFRGDDPANRVTLAPEDRIRLEQVLESLPTAAFTSDDGLGWVYQFWQSQRKAEVNKKGDKIGGADLPAVTQLFTEHYMVRFLLENSLGSWWAGRHPESPLLREWEYLRFRDDGTPAAGTFEDWPSRAAEVTVMDPCCGSGHFLVAAADMLRRMRMEEEGLTPREAAAAVIRDNLFGLELDPRCLQLAAFNLALDAWKVGGYQPLPIPNLACSGIAIKGQRADWHRLAGNDDRMREALDRLYELFQDAPELGSLIDPRSAAGQGLWAVDVDELLAKLDRALARETVHDPAAAVFGAAAVGAARAAQLLANRYSLVTTNPPFLGRADQAKPMRDYCNKQFARAKADLSTTFLLRFARVTGIASCVAMVLPSAFHLLSRYSALRRSLLTDFCPRIAVRVGTNAFAGISGSVVNVTLNVLASGTPRGCLVCGFTTDEGKSPIDKDRLIRAKRTVCIDASQLLDTPDARLVVDAAQEWVPTLASLASGLGGITTGDSLRYRLRFWEPAGGGDWELEQNAPATTALYAGREFALYWSGGRGLVPQSAGGGATIAGRAAWGRKGVAIRITDTLAATLYTGAKFENTCAVVLPGDDRNLPAIWSYCSSPDFYAAVRRIDTKLGVTNATLVKVPFDLERWQRVAAERFPSGLPEPHSDDPTQWLFKGNIVGSEAPLQVAVARLLGYRWPDQEPDELDELIDRDGLVPLPSVAGEASAAERLRALLARAYGDAWSPIVLERLLADAGSPGKTLETWLRDDFFAQHSKLFHHRPFIWHVWDGRKDGFSVLCHYHRLDRATLEKLTYTLLGDWIERQRAGGDEPGAEARLNGALRLQERLAQILTGEAPYDIYVRWKSLAEQPMGWEPDLDDGVRLNIRPFVLADVLRAEVKVKWDKDRGKDPDGSERINDRHLTLAQKRAARAEAGVA